MTAVLRHVPDLIWLRLLRRLCHMMATSAAVSPVFLKTNHHASYVHIVVCITFDLRLLLYARKTQTQCPQYQPIICTPIIRAVQSEYKDLFVNRVKGWVTWYLVPSPSFNSTSKVWALLTKVSYVVIVKSRLETLRCNRVPAFCPLFVGLQTGYYSLSSACRLSLGALGWATSLYCLINYLLV